MGVSIGWGKGIVCCIIYCMLLVYSLSMTFACLLLNIPGFGVNLGLGGHWSPIGNYMKSVEDYLAVVNNAARSDHATCLRLCLAVIRDKVCGSKLA